MPLRFISLPIRNLRQRRMRTVFTMLGVAVAVGGFLALTGLGRGVERAWVDSLSDQGIHLLGYRQGALDILTGSLDEHLAAEMKTVANVAEVSPELVDLVTLEDGDSVMVRGWTPDSALWHSGTVIAGRIPVAGPVREALLGESLAAALHRGAGDEVRLFGARVRVVGVARFGGVLTNHSLVMPLADMQEVLDRPGRVTVFNIRVAHGDDAAAVAVVRDRLNRRFSQLAFTETEALAQRNEIYRLWRGMAWATSLVGLAMGFVIVVNTMLVAVLERTREIGVLVAVGWSRGRILGLVGLEALALALTGGALGVLLGEGALALLAGHPKLRGFVAAPLSLDSVLQCLAVAALLGLGGALYPAWRAVRLKPVDALRNL